jgi:diguanylate cyclase (GGDEF)-like protein
MNPFKLVLQSLPTPVVVITGNGDPYYANRAAVDLLGSGVDPEADHHGGGEMYGARVLNSDEPYPCNRMPIVRALFGESSFVDDMVVSRPAGDVLLHVEGSPILDRKGNVEFAVACFQDISREQQLEMSVLKDPLTGVYNRLAMNQALHRVLKIGHEAKAPVGVLFIDIDGFKPLNDRFGHCFGDRLLVEFASRLRQSCRENEIPFRYGGDEFVLIFERMDADSLDRVRMRTKEATDGVYSIGGRKFQISATVGAALARGSAQTAEELLARADADMYWRKPEPKCLEFDALVESRRVCV